MLILLPPSEGKAADGDGAPVDVGALALPEVAEAREAVMAELVGLCRGPRERAREVLGLSAAQVDEALARNSALATASTLRAADLYTGVLYDRLRLPGLLAADPATARRTADSVLVFSGLWGVVGPLDRVPPYRLSMGVRLPGLGALGAFWRARLSDLLVKRAEGRLVLDCRSSTYAAAWRPVGETAERTAAVRVLRETVSEGRVRRGVVSHMAKATRGAVAHGLLAAGAVPATPEEAADAVAALGYRTELVRPDRPGRPWTLDVVERD
ncbi:peroxide stress protein YaaA [Streptomonospora sp. S1-112]|uniref:Peroxide stress protein YaaA n=1 Tax=Streptomonospora mangrovi TaxID=2883123 RepID=A0A9X3SGN1_9ACTN|nr:peroxide stress protein YaaA [Streptomonospora mangrovi]MDA0566115.1 peroxide stress protein YaaA [Streptomonospora mangrovi]